MIKAVLFDADGVIQSAAGDFIQRLESLVPERQDEFVADVFAAEKPCATGEADFPSQLAKVLERWQVATPVPEVLSIWRNIQLIEGLPGLLGKIQQRGIRVALATNQQAYRMDYMRGDLGLNALFDDSFYSCEVKAKKPAAEFFQAALQKLDLPAAQCLFIDDSEANVAGAKQQGLQAVYYQFKDLSAAAAELEALILARLE